MPIHISLGPLPVAHFLQWYSHLESGDQAMLRYFLDDWLKAQPEKQWVRLTPVIEAFLQGYAQFSQNDQQILCDFLRNSSKTPLPSTLSDNVYGGIYKASAPQERTSTITCPACKHKFQIDQH